jgi:hypothetical protein
VKLRTKIITTSLVAWAVALPVGFALADLDGAADESSSAGVGESVSKANRFYAGIPEGPISIQLVEACQREAVDRLSANCALLLEIADLRRDGRLEPGLYTKAELDQIVESRLP